MLEASPVSYSQKALFEVGEFEKRFPEFYLNLDEHCLESILDLSKIPDVERYARNNRESWQDEVKIISNGIVNFSNLIVQEHPDTIVLLDKSARPISQFLKSLWGEAYPGCHTPDIRFINIGREYSHKYHDEKLLADLYLGHSKYINNKKIIVADEVIYRGDSITMARNTILKVFPNIKQTIYTCVFGKETPFWFHPTLYMGLGVFDEMMPNDILAYVLTNGEQDTFFTKTVAGVARRHPEIANKSYCKDALDGTHECVIEFHNEVGYLGKMIAKSCQKYSKDKFFIKPTIPTYLNYLNNSFRYNE